MVDDDDCVGEALTVVLERHGYAVVRCGDGLEALAHLQRGEIPALILLDLMLPGMDGWEVRLALKREPAWADIPVVALSADTSAKAAAIDAEAFLYKPVQEDLLLQTLHAVLERPTTPGTSPPQSFEQLANPLCFAIENLELARGHWERLGSMILPSAPGIPVGTLLDRAHQSARSLVEMVYDATQFASMAHAPGVVDVARVLSASLALVRHALPAGTRVAQHIGPVPCAAGDAAKLGHVFVNVLRNAAEALAKCECPDLDLAIWNHKSSQVVVTISDNGAGVSPEIRERVFDPFFSTRPPGKASGLGLTVARRLLMQMGGVLELESMRGFGTTVLISLPHALGTEPTASPPVAMPRVLLVAESRAAACELSAMLGVELEVTTAASATEALGVLLGGATFDLVLCAAEACELSAVELYAELARKRPEQSGRIALLRGPGFSPQGGRMLDAMGLWHVERSSSARSLRAQVASLLCLWRALDVHGDAR